MVKQFIANPNKNGESFNVILRQLLKDLLELDAGVLVKVFTIDSYDFEHLEPKSGAPMLKPFGQRKMVELYARDGASFLKETDKFGFVRGHWQYSYQIPAHPMWFNKDEICYMMEQPRSLSSYGFSRTQAVLDLVKSLYYSTLYNKKFFEEVPLPEGVLALKDTNENEMRTFMDWWNREFKAQPHKLGIVNKDVTWQSFTIPNKELEFLETQKHYFNFVIAMFGLTPTELGLTEDSNRATSASQAELTKRKGIRPILHLIEKYMNSEIIPEFGFEGIEFTFIYDDPAEKALTLQNYQLELSMGIRTPNEIREEMGLQPIDGGDMSNNPMIRPMDPNQEDKENPDKDKRDSAEGKPKEETKKSFNELNELALERYNVPFNGLNNEEQDEIQTLFEQRKRKPIKKGLITSNMSEVIQQASADFGISIEHLTQGFEHELEHLESVGYDYNIILEIAIDHLKEDEEYYTKLKEIEKKLTNEEINELERKIMLDMGEEVYRILIATGMSPKQAASYAQKIKSRTRQKGIYDGQYYSEPNEVILEPRGEIVQPQNNELKDPIETQDTQTCPQCGKNTLAQMNSADDVGTQIKYRCSNCAAVMTQEEIESGGLANMESMTEENNSSKPISIPSWSPKSSFNKTFDWVGFDVNKAAGSSVEDYIDSKGYIRLLAKYLKDLSASKRNQIREIIKYGIKNNLSISDMTKQLNKLLDDKLRSESIIRTETVRVSNEAKIKKLANEGITKGVWLTSRDNRTCKICGPKNNKTFMLKSLKGAIPAHPQCRCTFSEI